MAGDRRHGGGQLLAAAVAAESHGVAGAPGAGTTRGAAPVVVLTTLDQSLTATSAPDTRYWYAVFAFRPVWLYTVAVPLCSGSAPVRSVSPFDDHST